MQTLQDSPQHLLLQRCKHTIQTLHQQLIHLQITNQLLISQKDSLKKIILQKDKIIYQLQQRLNNIPFNEKSYTSTYQQVSMAQREELFERYQKVVGENNELRREIERERSRVEKMEKRGMDSSLFCNRQDGKSEWGNNVESEGNSHDIVITVNDMLNSDKKILIYLVQQKDKQIESLTRLNKQLTLQNQRLSNYYKTRITRMDSEYQLGFKQDSIIGQILKTPKTKKKIDRSKDYGDEYGSVRKTEESRENKINRLNRISTSKSLKKSYMTSLKSSGKLLETERKTKERVRSPAGYY